jgi:hypothetical protein
MPVIPELGRLRQEDLKLQTSMGSIARPSQTTTAKRNEEDLYT